jgi:hypothetical protein
MHRDPSRSENSGEAAPDDIEKSPAVVDVVAGVGWGSRAEDITLFLSGPPGEQVYKKKNEKHGTSGSG